MSSWFLQAGRDRGHRYAVIGPSGLSWTADRAEATSFDTKAHAAVEQMELVADLGIQVAVVSAMVQPRASDLDYVRRAMTARDMRVGPGPERPAMHDIDLGGFQCGDQSSRTGAMRGGTRVERYPESASFGSLEW